MGRFCAVSGFGALSLQSLKLWHKAEEKVNVISLI